MSFKNFGLAIVILGIAAVVFPGRFYAATDNTQLERIIAMQQAEISMLKSDLSVLWKSVKSDSISLCQVCGQ